MKDLQATFDMTGCPTLHLNNARQSQGNEYKNHRIGTTEKKPKAVQLNGTVLKKEKPKQKNRKIVCKHDVDDSATGH